VENVQKSATDATQNSIMTPSEVIEATNANSSKKLLSNRQIAGVIVEILKSNGGSLPIENIAEEFAKKTQIPLIMLVRIKLKVRI
jgi:3,4-dihydroxy-2-butanone 4-phosphate synthase